MFYALMKPTGNEDDEDDDSEEEATQHTSIINENKPVMKEERKKALKSKIKFISKMIMMQKVLRYLTIHHI